MRVGGDKMDGGLYIRTRSRSHARARESRRHALNGGSRYAGYPRLAFLRPFPLRGSILAIIRRAPVPAIASAAGASAPPTVACAAFERLVVVSFDVDISRQSVSQAAV